MRDAAKKSVPADAKTRRFIFLLLNKFTMLSFACAIEPLRLANREAGKKLYELEARR